MNSGPPPRSAQARPVPWLNAPAEKPTPRVAPPMSDRLGSNPLVTPRWAEGKPGLAYNTVMHAIGLLQEQGIIAAVTEARRGSVFCAKALLDILEEPARLTPVLPPPPASGVNVP